MPPTQAPNTRVPENTGNDPYAPDGVTNTPGAGIRGRLQYDLGNYIPFIPGYQDMQPYDFGQLQNWLFGGGGNGGGGGRGGGGNGMMGTLPNMDYLNGLFGGGINNIGNIRQDWVNNISGLQGDMTGNYQNYTGDLMGLEGIYRNLIMGGPDGTGGYGSGVRGGFGGSGGVSQSSIEALLRQIPEFQAREIRTGLPELDAALAEEMDIIKQAQLADFERFREDQNSDLLTRMFGQGVQRSTVAGEAANRANESLERTKLQVLSEDIQRRLGIRKDEADRILAGDLASLQAEAGAYGDRIGSMTGIRQAEIGADAQVRSAGIGASAAAASAMEGDRLRALSSIFGSTTQGMASGFGTQQGAIGNFADLWGNMALGNQGNEIEKYLGLAGIAGNLETSRMSSQAQTQAARMQANAARRAHQLDYLRFQEDVAGRIQSGIQGSMSRDLQRYINDMNNMTNIQIGRMGEPSSTDQMLAFLGIIGSMYGSYS